MQKCYSNCAFAFNILLFFFLSFTSLFLFLSSLTLTSLFLFLHWSLLLSLHSCATANHLSCRNSRRLPLLSFFFVWWFWDFDQWFWWFWLVGFDQWFWWFWLVVLGFWWVGWWWWLGGLMMEAGLMIAAALFFLCLIVNDGWELCQEWIFYWINV